MCFVTFVISDLSLVVGLSLFSLLFLCLVLYVNFFFLYVPAAAVLSACLSVKQWQWRCQETIIQFRRQTLKRRLKNNDTRLKRWWSILLSVQGAVFPTPFLAFFFCCGGGERFLLSGIQQPDERTDGAQDAAPAVLALCCCCK